MTQLERIAKLFASAKSIWAGIFLFFTGVVFAGNLQWVQISEYRSDQKIIVIQQINREISDLKVQLLYTSDQQKKAMIQAIIINKETQIKNIKEKN